MCVCVCVRERERQKEGDCLSHFGVFRCLNLSFNPFHQFQVLLASFFQIGPLSILQFSSMEATVLQFECFRVHFLLFYVASFFFPLLQFG